MNARSVSRLSAMRSALIGTMVSYAMMAVTSAQAVTLYMTDPPQGQSSIRVGATNANYPEEQRFFNMRFTVQAASSFLTVTVNRDDGSMPAPLLSAGGCNTPSIYQTGDWDIIKKRSTRTAYASAPGATQSGTATVYIKKNGQMATIAPDWANAYHEYVWNTDGPSTFDCSGFLHYLHDTMLGFSLGDKTAQQYYSSSTQVALANRLAGDWLFFDWGDPPSSGSIDHTGVVAGGGMVHASSTAGQVVAQELTDYYLNHAFCGHFYGINERF